jgi:hypothetical protein
MHVTLALVGYAHGDELAEARRHGFERIGHLRIRINDTTRPT